MLGDWASMVMVGRIVRPHHNRGHVVVVPETDFAADRFRSGERLHTAINGALRVLTVSASREHDGRWVVGFEGFATIDDAERLRNCELRIPADAVHELEPGRYYVHDLVGCEVRTMSGRSLGTVARVDMNSGLPLLVVGTREVLVPFTDAICRRVDIAARWVEVDPPEGLIELNGPA